MTSSKGTRASSDYIKSEELHNIEVEKLGRPFFLAKWFVKCPCLVILVCWIVFIAFMLAFFFTDLYVQDAPHPRDFLVWNNDVVVSYDVLTTAQKVIAEEQAELGAGVLRQFQIQRWQTVVQFACDECETLMSKEGLEQVYAVEQKIIGDAEYSNFCKATSSTDTSCDVDEGYFSITKAT